MSTVDFDFLVIGGGAVGLAIGSRLAKRGSVLLLERHPKFGQECSSRNSEVIHSGIYYPVDSKKTRLCIRGRELLYGFCEKNSVGHRKLGKYVVAINLEQEAYLERLAEHCRAVDVPHRRANAEEMKKAEPLVTSVSALFFPETGIVNSHEYLAALERELVERGGTVAYRHRLLGAERGAHWNCRVSTPDGETEMSCNRIINAAGLGAAELRTKILGDAEYEHRFCRGRYFTLSGAYRGKFQHLIYPVPEKDGLGVHVTLDLEGYARLGPDVDWATNHVYAEHEHLYECDWEALEPRFLHAVRTYCPSIREGELSPGLIGIRAKLFRHGEAVREFVLDNRENSLHCLGIESPGLTASLALAEEVEKCLS